MDELFTIGHSTHELDEFLGLLKQHAIEVVADVRSSPVSRLPWFCQVALKKALKENGIRYVFLGAELGARREERDCYVEHRADYERIAKTAAYRRGMERLRKGVGRYRVALMCAEREPLDCHRTILVCRDAKAFARISHIHADGHLESHEEAENRMLDRYQVSGPDLFLARPQQLSDAYRRRGLEINYVEKTETPVVREEPYNDEY